MDSAGFSARITATRGRIEEFRRSLDAPSATTRLDVLGKAVEELSTAVEELRVADEELRVQNEELVHARHNAEQDKARYEDLFEFAPGGYLVTDSCGVIRQANQQVVGMLGKPKEYLRGKPLVVFVPEWARRDFREHLASVARENSRAEWETWFIRPGEFSALPVAVTVDIVRTFAEQEGTLRWLIRDLTPIRKMQNQVRDLDSGLWIRVAERTRQLVDENERLRVEISLLKKQLGTGEPQPCPAEPAPSEVATRQHQSPARQG